MPSAASAAPASGASPGPEELLEFREDAYQGVYVSSKALPDDPAAFRGRLRRSLAHWRSSGVRGVWLKLPIDRATLVPMAVAEGFQYHHAEKAHVTLTHWLSGGEPNRLPANPSHHVGVGGWVVRADGRMLVVKEARGPVTSIWKLPGGAVDCGEDVAEAAVREVLEETGLECEFRQVLCIREMHNARFGKDDFYFVAHLVPKDESKADAAAPRDGELAQVAWVTVDEFCALPYYKGLYKAINAVSAQTVTASPERPGFIAERYPVVFRPGNNTLYQPAFADGGKIKGKL